MSTSYNNKRKASRAKRTTYAKELARKVKAGVLPSFYFAKDGNSLERVKSTRVRRKTKLTLKQVGTIASLTKDYAQVAEESKDWASQSQTPDSHILSQVDSSNEKEKIND